MQLKRGHCDPSSEIDGKIYRLAVPILKSTQNLVISGCCFAETAKKCTKKVMHVQSCCFSHKTYCLLDIPIAIAVKGL